MEEMETEKTGPICSPSQAVAEGTGMAPVTRRNVSVITRARRASFRF